MAGTSYQAELNRAGAGATGGVGKALHLARQYPLGAIGAVIMTVFVLAAIFADLITTQSPLTTNSAVSLAAPDGTFWMGTDFMGRDVYARIVYGARISLAVGIGSTTLGCLIGVAVGLASGYIGGWFDLIVQRVMDIMQALPLLVLALVFAAALGPSLPNTIIPSPFRWCRRWRG